MQGEMEIGEGDPGMARDAEILKIRHLVDFICKKFFLVDFKNVAYTFENNTILSGFVFTTYSYMRRSNNASNQSAGKYGDYIQTHGGVTSTVRALATDYAKTRGFEAFDFRTATPLVAMLTSLPSSFTEVHMGMTKVPGKNKVGNERGKNITAYGLNNAHIPLLHGVTFPPERRTSLLRGLGPMTLAIMLIEENTYKQKIKDALLQSIKHLPNATSIVEALANGT